MSLSFYGVILAKVDIIVSSEFIKKYNRLERLWSKLIVIELRYFTNY